MNNMKKSAGLSGGSEQLCRSTRPPTAAAARNIPGAAWIDDEAVADTIAVWAPSYGGVLTESDAVEILMNVKNLVDALVRAARKQ